MFAEASATPARGGAPPSIAEGKYTAMGWVMVTDQDGFDAGMAAHGGQDHGRHPELHQRRSREVLIGEITGGSQ